MSRHDCPRCGLPRTKTPRRTPLQSPFEAHLGTNVAFIVQDHVRVDIVSLVAKAKADIADLDRDIGKLETSLAAAKKERDEMIAYHDAHLMLFPPVHQLPTEVLTEIFHLTFEKPYDVFASSRSGPWLLGKVCSRWRQIAWSCASLWTNFIVADPPSGDGRSRFHEIGTQDLFEGALSRSAKCNKFHIPLRGLTHAQTSGVLRSAEGWHDASFHGSLQEFQPFPKSIRLDSLVALGLELHVYFTDVDAYYQLVSSLGQHVPQLRKLTLTISTFYPPTDTLLWKINLPWSQLTELIIPLDYIVSCQHLLASCPSLKTLRDIPHLSQRDRVKEGSSIPGLQPVVAHTKLSLIDMSPSPAITLLDYIQCPALAHLKVPCPRAYRSDKDIFQRFVQRSDCRITRAEFIFNDQYARLASPEACLSALSWITDLQLSFRVAEGFNTFLLDCLSDWTLVPQLRVLTITSTAISRSIWNAELQDTLIGVLNARSESHEEVANLQKVDIVLGREMYMMPGRRSDDTQDGHNNGSTYYLEGLPSLEEDHKRHVPWDLGRDFTIVDSVDADFIEFQKLKDRGLDIRLSMWKGRTLVRYV